MNFAGILNLFRFMVTFHTFVDIDSLDDYISGLQEIYDKKHTVTCVIEFFSYCFKIRATIFIMCIVPSMDRQ